MDNIKCVTEIDEEQKIKNQRRGCVCARVCDEECEGGHSKSVMHLLGAVKGSRWCGGMRGRARISKGERESKNVADRTYETTNAKQMFTLPAILISLYSFQEGLS